jgi:hypothetical protein
MEAPVLERRGELWPGGRVVYVGMPAPRRHAGAFEPGTNLDPGKDQGATTPCPIRGSFPPGLSYASSTSAGRSAARSSTTSTRWGTLRMLPFHVTIVVNCARALQSIYHRPEVPS